MDGALARAYMENVKGHVIDAYRRGAEDEEDQKAVDKIEEAFDLAIAALPPRDSHEINYISVSCPATDMVPYEDMERIRIIDDRIESAFDDEENLNLNVIEMADEEALMVQRAMTVYKSALMQVHKKRIQDDINAVIMGMAKAVKEKDDESRED